MAKGLDCYTPITQSTIDVLNKSAAEYTFIGRYYSRYKKDKELTSAEAERICNSNRSIVSIYQDANNTPGAFNTDNGVQDGDYAWRYAQSIGQTSNTPIYFAVDFDLSDRSLYLSGKTKEDVKNQIAEYFKAVQGQFAFWNNKSEYNYKIGIYGCGEICQYIKQEKKLATYSWLSMSTAWPGYNAYNKSSLYNIKQDKEVYYNKVKFDTNQSGDAGEGSWRYKK